MEHLQATWLLIQASIAKHFVIDLACYVRHLVDPGRLQQLITKTVQQDHYIN